MGKNKDKIKVEFLGNNAIDVTGSAILITTDNNKQILLECGMIQNCDSTNDFKLNSKPFAFKAKNIDYVIICHQHQDHIGLIPKLLHDGFKGKIIATEIASKFFKPMWKDSCKIIEYDSRILSKQRKKTVLPYYDETDVYNALDLTYEYDYNKIYDLDENISFKFLKNSHILGAAQVELYIKDNMGVQKTILYTSDLGSFKVKNHYVENNDKSSKANIVISECTYGKRTQESAPNREKDLEKLKTKIKEVCIDNKGRLLIPVFALSRSQEILTNLYKMYKDDSDFNIPIYVDSPLIITLNKVYCNVLKGEDLELFKKVCDWQNVHFIESVEESNACIKDKRPKIVLSSSGFLTNGRSCSYLKEYIQNEKDCVISVGYSPNNSVFGKIKNGEPIIKIDKKNYKNKCTCMSLYSFSSHVPRHELLSYLKSIYTEKYYLVHGEESGKLEFKENLEEELSKMCRTSQVVSTTKNTICYL